jgi:DNA repair protein RadA/Sms
MKCSACSREVATKEPRCPHCGRWGTIARWRRATELERRTVERIGSGIPEIDRLLGGGWVPGCVYRLSGPPGSGKSTLALDIAMRAPSIYAAAEESAAAIRSRFDRLLSGSSGRDLMIGEVSSVEELDDVPEGTRFVVVDSLHRLRSPAIAGAAGSNGQLLHAIEKLVAFARARGVVVLAISHVNREGDASGTTGVDHDADALLEMTRASEDDENGTLRVLKNRHGPAPRAIAVQIHEGGLTYAEKKESSSKPASKRPALGDPTEVHP